MKSYFNLWKTNVNKTSQTIPHSFVKAEEKFKELGQGKSLEILLNVLEVCRCHACKLVLTHPFVVCVDGHAICATCQPNDAVCPTCSKAFKIEEQSTLISAVLLIPHECRHRGCFAVVIPGDDHALWCGFRDTSCRLCDWVGAGRNIVRHVKCSHSLDKIELNEFTFLCELRDFDTKENRTEVAPIFVGNEFIWSETKTVNNNHYGTEFQKNYFFVPDGKKETKMWVEVTFGDDSIRKELSLHPIHSLTDSSRNSVIFPAAVFSANTDDSKTLHWKEVFTFENLTSTNNQLDEFYATSKAPENTNQETKCSDECLKSQNCSRVHPEVSDDAVMSLRKSLKNTGLFRRSSTEIHYAKTVSTNSIDGTPIEELNTGITDQESLKPFKSISDTSQDFTHISGGQSQSESKQTPPVEETLIIPKPPPLIFDYTSSEPFKDENSLPLPQSETDTLELRETDGSETNSSSDPCHITIPRESGSEDVDIKRNKNKIIAGVDLSIFYTLKTVTKVKTQ